VSFVSYLLTLFLARKNQVFILHMIFHIVKNEDLRVFF
jgi:hypothetical protein